MITEWEVQSDVVVAEEVVPGIVVGGEEVEGGAGGR